MRKKLFALQTAGSAAAMAAAYLVLLIPDSTAGYLLLSLLLMYSTLFLLSFTLAAVGGTLATQWDRPPGLSNQQAGAEDRQECLSHAPGWGDFLRHGWRGWGRAAAILLVAAGVLYCFHRLRLLRLPVWASVLLLALLAIPAVVHGTGLAPARIPRLLAYAALGVVLSFAAWKILTTPAELSRPWMEIAYLGLRVSASFLLANLACVLLLAAGALGLARSP